VSDAGVRIDRPTAAFPPSLVLSFDASVLYGSNNATPVSGAVGFVVEEGSRTHLERSLRVSNLVSSTALEYRALLEAVRTVVETFEEVASLHLRGDAAVVLDAVDRRRDVRPSGRVERRRVRHTRRLLDSIPTVTYRVVPRSANERAHRLARAGHDLDPGDGAGPS
jgi:ribonuclease HI